MFRIRDLKKSYKKNKVLDIKSYDFKSRGLYIIVGPNGSGKTTLLKALTNQIKYEGEIYFNNINIKDYKNDLLKKVCYVPQFNTLFNNMNTNENLNYNNMFLNKELNYNDKNKSHNIIKHMSGGQKKNANLERFLSLDYECLILDEPTTSLDKYNKNRLLEYIKENKETKLIICVTHDEDLIELADKKIDINNIEVSKEEFDIQNYEYIKTKEYFGFKEFLSYLFENKLLLFFRFIALSFFIIALFLLVSFLSFDANYVTNEFVSNNYLYSEVVTDTSNMPSNEYDIDNIVNGDLRYDYYTANDMFECECEYINESDEEEVSDINFSKNGYQIIFTNNIDDIEVTDYLAEQMYDTTDVIGNSLVLYFYGESDQIDFEIGNVISTDYLDYNYDNYKYTGAKYFMYNRGYMLVSSKYFSELTNYSYYLNLESILTSFSYITFDFNLKGDDYYYISASYGLNVIVSNGNFYSYNIKILSIMLTIIMIFSALFLLYISIIDNRKINKKINKNNKLKIYSASTRYRGLMYLIQDVFLGIFVLIIGIIIGYLALNFLNKNIITPKFYYLVTNKYYLKTIYYPAFIIFVLYGLFIGYKLLALRKK